MLQIIIFSFNRALQLDTLISSLVDYWETPGYHIDIIFNTSSQLYQDGYDLLMRKWIKYKNIEFHKESAKSDVYKLREKLNIFNLIRLYRQGNILRPKSDFRSLLISLLKKNVSKHVMFLTDDAMFIKPVQLGDGIFEWIDQNPVHRQFSLRLGEQMNVDTGTVYNTFSNCVSWNFFENSIESNWGYSFSVDAHIYSKKEIISLFTAYIFCNPNTLEGNIQGSTSRKHWFGEGMAFLEPKILSYPINIVQNVVENESLGVDCELLNNWFMDGYSLKYPIPDKITSFQQYPEFVYLIKDGVSQVKRLK